MHNAAMVPDVIRSVLNVTASLRTITGEPAAGKLACPVGEEANGSGAAGYLAGGRLHSKGGWESGSAVRIPRP